MLSLFALIMLSIPMLAVAILVRIKLGSPVIFCQERPGKNEKIFKLYKFRTMTDARDESGELLPVRTAAPVLFAHMMDVMAAMKATTAKLPVKMGDTVIANVADGIDLIACRSIDKK
jgi:lipopolysaccharide/colanic/teichoic acid biosynthesis glycosyltransferase